MFMIVSSSHIEFFSVSSLHLRRLIFCRKFSSPHACCISHKSHYPWFYHFDHVQGSVQIVTFFCIQVNVRRHTSRSHDCLYYRAKNLVIMCLLLNILFVRQINNSYTIKRLTVSIISYRPSFEQVRKTDQNWTGQAYLQSTRRDSMSFGIGH